VVEVELVRILMSQVRAEQVIVLKEKAGARSFPIVIGPTEAWAINRGLRGEQFIRPLTHDLLGNVIQALGATLERIVVCDLRELQDFDNKGTFYATLVLRQNGNVVEIDSRPSDAIALATQMHAPIFVEERVLEEAAGPADDADDEFDSEEESEE